MKAQRGFSSLNVMFIGIIIFAVITYVSMQIHYTNSAVSIENTLIAQRDDNKNQMANMSNVIVEIARAAKLGMDAQTNLIKVANESRYGDDGVKGVVNMITEQNPSINGELAVKLQQVIESERTRYKNSQSKMLDIKRSYLTLLQSMPSSHFLKGFPKIDLKQFDVITNDYTQKAYSSGKSEAVEF